MEKEQNLNNTNIPVVSEWVRCNTCKYIKKYESGGRVYCEKQTSKACLHGFKRIRRTDNACPLYEKVK